VERGAFSIENEDKKETIRAVADGSADVDSDSGTFDGDVDAGDKCDCKFDQFDGQQ
jgi:hypothetical protein